MAAPEHNESSPPLSAVKAAPSPAISAATPPGPGLGQDEARRSLQLQPEQQQPPPLEPLFTLLTNATKKATVHPRVRYLFADDDSSILADPPTVDECGRPMRIVVVDLVPPSSRPRHASSSSQGRTSQLAAVPPLALPSWSSSSLPHDASSRGWTVACAASLSPDFAVTNARLCEPALQAQNHANATGGAPVLRIEGVEREPLDGRAGAQSASSLTSGALALSKQDMDGLADEFRRRVGVLRGVAVEADRRSAALARLDDEHEQNQHGDQNLDSTRDENAS